MQRELFPDPATRIAVDPNRREPSLWVRRLVIWEKVGEPLRDIPLRKGLNIIWSPDPGEHAAELGRESGQGHGAGKTLFCRLLRYCLGESSFANAELSVQIGTAMPDGQVGSEVLVGGELWSIVRPMGDRRKVVVGRDVTLEELLAGNRKATGMAPFLEAIERSVMPRAVFDRLPGTRDSSAWLTALALLSRDQECRLEHVLEWRHSQSESGSVVRSISKERLLDVVRVLLRILTSEELEARAHTNAAMESRTHLELELSHVNRTLDSLTPQVLASTGLESGLAATRELALSRAHQIAADGARAAEAALDAGDDDGRLRALRTERETLLHALAAYQAERSQALLDLARRNLEMVQQERSMVASEAIKARLGPVCPVCKVSIDRALAEGCSLSHENWDLEELRQRKERLDAQCDEQARAVTRYEQQLRERESLIDSLEARERDLSERIREAEEERRRGEGDRRTRWYEAVRLVEQTGTLDQAQIDRERLTHEVEELRQQEERGKRESEEHRDRHREDLRRLNDLFSYVCAGILGPQARASVNLTATELRARVRIGGTAMHSLKIVAFDLATMLLSVEGRTALPAFLVHDSPREGDLGTSLYQKLFRLIALLEGLGDGSAPFQYIVTTTSDPPEELRRKPYLIEVLNGVEDRGALLRRVLSDK